MINQHKFGVVIRKRHTCENVVKWKYQQPSPTGDGRAIGDAITQEYEITDTANHRSLVITEVGID